MGDVAGINDFSKMAASTGILHKKQSRTFVEHAQYHVDIHIKPKNHNLLSMYLLCSFSLKIVQSARVRVASDCYNCSFLISEFVRLPISLV